MPRQPIRAGQFVARASTGSGVVAALTFLGFRILHVNAATQGFLYLVFILLIATSWGLAHAVIASVVAVGCLNYFFLPPIGTFVIADPQNWVALGTFLITAILTSRLSAQAKHQAQEVLNRQEELERLYALSRAMLLLDPSQPVAAQVAQQIARTFEASGVALYVRADQSVHRSGPEDFPGSGEQLREAAVEGTQFHDARNWITAIRLGGEPIGGVGISGVDLSDSGLQSLANLAAIGLERARAQEAATKAEVARQSDELKSMLMDAIAHEFQTPLTTIKAAASTMLSDPGGPGEQRTDLLHLVDEEAQRLSTLVSDAIHVARIEAGRVRLDRQRISASALAENVLREKASALGDRHASVDAPADLAKLWVDPELGALALRQLLDNAIKYSHAGSSIEISARADGEQVVLSVRDHGQGIPAQDLPHVFEKFYRGAKARSHIAGSGLGLAIVHAVVDAHGGRVWAESKAGEGSIFHMSLPAVKEKP